MRGFWGVVLKRVSRVSTCFAGFLCGVRGRVGVRKVWGGLVGFVRGNGESYLGGDFKRDVGKPSLRGLLRSLFRNLVSRQTPSETNPEESVVPVPYPPEPFAFRSTCTARQVDIILILFGFWTV